MREGEDQELVPTAESTKRAVCRWLSAITNSVWSAGVGRVGHGSTLLAQVFLFERSRSRRADCVDDDATTRGASSSRQQPRRGGRRKGYIIIRRAWKLWRLGKPRGFASIGLTAAGGQMNFSSWGNLLLFFLRRHA